MKIDLVAIFKLLMCIILCFWIVSALEHGSKNWGKDFMKKCCACEVKNGSSGID